MTKKKTPRKFSQTGGYLFEVTIGPEGERIHTLATPEALTPEEIAEFVEENGEWDATTPSETT